MSLVITAPSHGLSNGDQVKIDNVVGMTQLNGKSYLVAGADTNTFHLHTLTGVEVDGSEYPVYISGGEVRKMVTDISGLLYLAGETVQVQTDGNVPVVNSFVVSGAGHITLSSKAAVVHAGLPYTGTIQFLKMSEGSAQGTGQTKVRRIYLSALRLFRSLGIGKIGQDADNCTEDINFGNPETSAIYTGDIKKFFTTWWADNAEVTIKVTQPLPVFLLAAIFSSEVEEN